MAADALLTPPRHGADLAAASRHYGIPIADWLDVSTGINPRAYPIGAIDTTAYQHLPCDDSALRTAAKNYCNAEVLPVVAAGSQVLIQWFPLVYARFEKCNGRIAVPSIGYSEHAFRWRWAGHEIIYYDPREPDSIDALLAATAIDVLIVINVHNPLGLITAPEKLLAWHTQLQKNNGWLIVDEAFIDPLPQHSVAAHTQLPGLIVLRSLGKFFGLAGVRCGYAFCNEKISTQLHIAVGPWAVSGPTLAIATAALRDRDWQNNMRAELRTISAVNADLLKNAAWAAEKKLLCNPLFNTLELSAKNAVMIEGKLAHQGIRVRRIELNSEWSLLRFGLVDPVQQDDWHLYEKALKFVVL